MKRAMLVLVVLGVLLVGGSVLANAVTQSGQQVDGFAVTEDHQRMNLSIASNDGSSFTIDVRGIRQSRQYADSMSWLEYTVSVDDSGNVRLRYNNKKNSIRHTVSSNGHSGVATISFKRR